MAGPTTIEWTERTWNPVTGCDRVSAGCDHCYALTLAARLKAMGNPRYQRDGSPITSGQGFGLTLHEDLVDLPRRWRTPATVFVNSMSDLFHDRVPEAFISAVFQTMVETPQHTYQVLTKRATRLTRLAPRLPWPENVWMGVSVEDQVQVERRARRLLTVPAWVRFLSCEPLLGPLDLRALLARTDHDEYVNSGLNWVIGGGESGPGARPCQPNWLRSLRDQCRQAGVAFFCKQLGSAWARSDRAGDAKGGDPGEWPEDLRVRDMPWVRI